VDLWFGTKPAEVNVWHPGVARGFRALSPGEPYLFKLHAPEDAIVGGGFFVTYASLPLSYAWRTFGRDNGVSNSTAFLRAFRKLGGASAGNDPDPEIGCTILAHPFLFDRVDRIPVPRNWKRGIVRGKLYTTDSAEGSALWFLLRERLQQQSGKMNDLLDALPFHGVEELFTVIPPGPGVLKLLVTRAYDGRCCVTGERALPVLNVATIRPEKDGGSPLVSNALLLRSDLHALFCRGYLTVTPDYRVKISPRLSIRFGESPRYRDLNGATLKHLPGRLVNRPDPRHLRWHGERIFSP